MPHMRDGLCRIECRITPPLASASVTESPAIIVADLKGYTASKLRERSLSKSSINKTLKVLAVAPV